MRLARKRGYGVRGASGIKAVYRLFIGECRNSGS